MTPPNAGPIVLPALRGIMGNRAYYSCLMTLRELATRVNYAKEIHANESLSDMIQKALERQAQQGDRSLSTGQLGSVLQFVGGSGI